MSAHPDTGARKDRRGRWQRILAFAVCFPLGLGVMELALKTTRGWSESRRDTIETDYMPTRLRPNFRGHVGDLYFETNQFGFRSQRDLGMENEAGKLRILTLGDSIGFGFGIAFKDHYSTLLEATLNKEIPEPGVEVINAAGQGYSPSNYYAYLSHEGLEFAPDFVLVQVELTNDIPDEALLDWAHDTPSKVIGGRYRVSWDGNLLGTYSMGLTQLERSYLYTFAVRQILRSGGRIFGYRSALAVQGQAYFHQDFENVVLSAGRLETGWNRFLGALEETGKVLERERIPWAVLVVPPRFRFQPQSPAEYEFSRKLLSRAQRALEVQGIPTVWITEALEKAGGSSLYLDFGHLTVEGNKVLAGLLEQEIKTVLVAESANSSVQ